MKYLLIAVLLWGCTGDLQLQGKRHPLGVYSEGKLIGYGQLEPEKMYLGEGITAGPPHILIADARPFICILTDTNRYPIDSKWISAFLKASENYLYMDMRSKPPEPCKHIYVATLSAEIKIEQPALPYAAGMGMPAPGIWPVRQSGKKEGQEIVCVKCHHVTKQVLDYGPPDTVKTSLIDWRSIPQFIIGQFTDTLEYVQSYIGEGGGGSSEFDSTIGGGTMRLTSPGRVWYVDSTGAVQVRKEDYKNWPESSFEVPTKNPVYDRIKSLQKRKKKK